LPWLNNITILLFQKRYLTPFFSNPSLFTMLVSQQILYFSCINGLN
jgi:hypothetical protein